MKIKSKIILSLSLLLTVSLVWYLLIKENDYIISFKVKAATGTVFQGIKEWSDIQSHKGNEKTTIIEKRNFDFIKQRITKDKTQLEYTWDMETLNDSITKVSVGIKDLNHSLYNRLTVPFFSTQFKTEQISKIKSFKSGLEDYIDDFKVRIDGEKSAKEIYVAYISLKSVLQEKAQTMIGNDAKIVGYLARNKIKIIGHRPYLEITKWDHDRETISFNYCFPIPKNAKYVPDKNVKFKTIPEIKGLQATYFGNMRTSDRAWFSILDYAKKNGYELNNMPLEHFLANPFNGGNELEWETQVIIPFKKK